jgi:hypothetical protein
MEKLNNLTTAAIVRMDVMLSTVKDEEGSEVAQAAGVAILASILIGALSSLSGSFRAAVTTGIQKAITALNF